MKIIFANRYFYPDQSATSRILTDLAFELAASGAPVTVIASRQRYDQRGADLPPREAVSGVEIRRVRTSRFGRASLPGRLVDYLTYYVSAALEVWKIVRKGDIVVVKTDPPLFSVLAVPLAHARGARAVNWIQDLYPEVAERLGVPGVKGPLGSLLRALRNASLRRSDANVAVGEGMKRLLEAQGVPGVRVIPNWADGKALGSDSAIEQDALRRKWNLVGKFVVGYSGNLGRAHEFETLLDAAGLLCGEPDVVFLLVGEGAQCAHLKSEVAHRNLTNVRFKPSQPLALLGSLLRVADVHVVTINPEVDGLIVPSKFYGIAAVARPVLYVGPESGDVAREILAFSCGFVLANGDSRALAGRILRLRHDPAERARLGGNARAAFDHGYGVDAGVRAWRQILGGLSGGKLLN